MAIRLAALNGFLWREQRRQVHTVEDPAGAFPVPIVKRKRGLCAMQPSERVHCGGHARPTFAIPASTGRAGDAEPFRKIAQPEA